MMSEAGMDALKDAIRDTGKAVEDFKKRRQRDARSVWVVVGQPIFEGGLRGPERHVLFLMSITAEYRDIEEKFFTEMAWDHRRHPEGVVLREVRFVGWVWLE